MRTVTIHNVPQAEPLLALRAQPEVDRFVFVGEAYARIRRVFQLILCGGATPLPLDFDYRDRSDGWNFSGDAERIVAQRRPILEKL